VGRLEVDGEAAAFARFALDRNGAVLRFGEVLDDREAQAGALPGLTA
jgi:hypothetical protein